jgi:HEPN domain-containing protein
MSEAPDFREAVRFCVVKAEHDLKTAEHTLQIQDDCPFEIVCFHAQQCAEKYLKALLVSRSIDFPKTHDLRYLLELLPVEFNLGLELSEVAFLNRYAVDGRYPGAWDEITRAQAERAIALARKVRDAVRAHIPT